MRTMMLLTTLSLACLMAMVVVDCMLGTRAEFLNAWSVVERLLGRAPAAGDSWVFRKFGALGEAIAVVAANVAMGGLATGLIRALYPSTRP